MTTMETCKKGHEAHRDAGGYKRCHTCDRERYRAKHPFHKADKMMVSGHLAPRLRSLPKKTLNRRITTTAVSPSRSTRRGSLPLCASRAASGPAAVARAK